MWYVVVRNLFYFFFFSSRRRHTRCGRDWSQTCALPILVGLSIKEIRDSHAAGTVTGKNQVGGLVGHAVWSSSISNSYATGDVTGEDMVGGLVGQSEADSARSEERRVGKECSSRVAVWQ